MPFFYLLTLSASEGIAVPLELDRRFCKGSAIPSLALRVSNPPIKR